MALVPYTNIEDGESADANVWNSRFGALLAQLNGNLDASNIRNGSLTRELFAGDAVLSSWPVGSVYLSVDDANPASLLGGGTWVRIAQGRALVGVDESDDDFDESEKTAGSKTHTLTNSEAPSHSHGNGSLTTSSVGNHNHSMSNQYLRTSASGTSRLFLGGGAGQQVRWDGGSPNSTNSGGGHSHNVTGSTASSGGGQAHNNVQPSFSLYVWKRVS